MRKRLSKYSTPDEMLNNQLSALEQAVPDAVDVILDVLKSDDDAIKKQRTEIALKILTSVGIFDKLAVRMTEHSTKKLVNTLIDKFNKNMQDSKQDNNQENKNKD
jgi:hypothetical protein